LKNQKLDDEYGISWWMDSDTLKQHLIWDPDFGWDPTDQTGWSDTYTLPYAIQSGVWWCGRDWSGRSGGCICSGFRKRITRIESWDYTFDEWDADAGDYVEKTETYTYFGEDWQHYDFQVGANHFECLADAGVIASGMDDAWVA
jgi:hypothetical protein